MLVPSGPAGSSWVLTNADHVVDLVVGLGLLFRRTVQRRHFGLPTDNDGGSGCEYIVGLGGRSFWWCLLACLLGLPTSCRDGTILVVLRI